MVAIDIVRKIADELSLKEYQVHNTCQLLFEEECTIPFVARYRKEKTGSLDEVQIKDIRDRYTYVSELKDTIDRYLKVVKDHCDNRPEYAGQYPALEKKFRACETKQQLEDLYLPFKPKRRTRAQIAKEKGLLPLLNQILEQVTSLKDLNAIAEKFVNAGDSKVEPDLQVKSAAEALKGAADIFAEQTAETAHFRQLVRDWVFDNGLFTAKKLESVPNEDDLKNATKQQKDLYDKAKKFKDYFDFSEPVRTAVSHRIMACRRGEAEKVLRVQIVTEAEIILDSLKKAVLADKVQGTPEVKSFLASAIEDAFKRLLWPSIETEVRLELKKRAEEDAIKVFSQNLENLLLLPPIPNKVVLGVDPGLRTGSKLAVVDQTGKLLAHDTIYPDLKDEAMRAPKTIAAKDVIKKMIVAHKVEYIAIGNGTGSREIDRLIRTVIRENNFDYIKRLVVNESGASVYSTDAIAREEFPDLDPTIRSAISIARRLQDPLAELVKIDPKSIGVGQYQHDVNVSKLKNSLEEVVEICVNKVGVNLNTASFKLLSYVSGIGPTLAKNIVQYRDNKGEFSSRQALNEVSGFGPKVFQQSAGFLRVPTSKECLDNSAVHPERYAIVGKIAQDHNKTVAELIGDQGTISAIPLENYISEEVGLPTLKDIAAELLKPGRDPREDGARLVYNDDVCEIEDLKEGMKLKGTVTNVTNFGAFVDIGVHQDGLVHISELSEKFVDDPSKVVSVGDVIDVQVKEVDLDRRRISLSRKFGSPRPQQTTANKSPRPGSGPVGKQNDSHQQRSQSKKPAPPSQPQFTLDDLVNKFNQKR